MVAVLAASLAYAPLLAEPAFAGEAGSASSQPLFINDRYVSAEVAADAPPILRGGEERILLEVAIHDVDTDPPVPVSDVSYNLVIRTGSDVLLDLDVHSPSGVSAMGIIPDASGGATVVSQDAPVVSGALDRVV